MLEGKTMSDERKRILQMFAEGKISLEECDELLESFQQREGEAGKLTEESQPRTGKALPPKGRKISWVVLLGLALIAIFYFVVFVLWASAPRDAALNLAVLLLPAIVAPAVFWLCMLIDCLSRDRADFGALITDKHDKLVWLLFILFAPLVGAVAYALVIRRHPRRSLPAESRTGPVPK